MMANIIIINLDWIRFAPNQWPVKKIPMELPWDKIENIQGFCGEDVLMDVSSVLEDLEKFKKVLLQIKKNTDRLDGKLITE